MNFYMVVEGKVVEKSVYKVWVPEIRSDITYVDHPSKLRDNNFAIVSGNGYPNYFDTIRDAIIDVSSIVVPTRLIVCIDSEDMTLIDKHHEIDSFINDIGQPIDYRVVVQHFCFETWALGNRRIAARNPKNPRLQQFRRLHDVLKLDPENMPGLTSEGLNRSQLAATYLQLTLNDKNKRLTYSKSNPHVVAHSKYFKALKSRRSDTSHIKSFDAFLAAFI